MATIRDVAEKAKVNPSTVSRVFSGKATISEATRQRVLAAAEELGFRPNAIARSLSIRRTNTIGIVVPHVYEGYFDDAFFPQLMRGMLDNAYSHDFRLIVGGSQGPDDEIKQILDIVHSSQADGIVIMSSRLDVDTVGALLNQDTPFVLIGHPGSEKYQDQVAWVDADNIQATEEAIEYLLELGHTRIAYVGGDPEIVTTQERQQAYRSAMEAAGIKVNPGWIDYGYFDEPGGYIAVQRMSELGNQTPTAYYAANDLMAIGIMRALREIGVEVPQEVSVIGTNNSNVANYTTPPLSSIKVPYAEMASQAVHMLIQHINEGAFPQNNYTVNCSLALRASTAPAPAN